MINVTILIIAIIGALFVYSGFRKRTDVLLYSYSVSANGSEITVSTILQDSMGYIRDIAVEKDGDKIYAIFYTTFGGLNSKIGAKNEFDIEVNPSCKEIYFYRGEAGYDLVLQKDESINEWVQR